MPQDLHCRHCDRVVPMLDEHEWARMQRALWQDQRRRRTDPASGRLPDDSEACRLYQSITGVTETDAEAIWHHRRALYGQICHACGRPLRSAQAAQCARCGSERPLSGKDGGRPAAH